MFTFKKVSERSFFKPMPFILLMTICRSTSKRKSTGGRLKSWRKKRSHALGRDTRPAMMGEEKKTQKRARGGAKTLAIVKTQFANLIEKGKAQKVKILDVIENKASRHFVRQKVLTKGAVIKTEKGAAVITSRPTRDGTLNAKLVKPEKNA